VSKFLPSRLSPDAVGDRVSVRRRLPGSGAGALGDVIGDLLSLDADSLVIRRSDASLVVVAAADVMAARVVGPSPRAALELEAVSGRSWPAPDDAWLGRWWLRGAAGFTARANAVRPLGDPGVSIDEALAHVSAWYAERDLPPMVRSVKGNSVDAELDRRGWTSDFTTVMQTATVAAARRRLVGVPTEAVRVASSPSAAWIERYGRGAGPEALSVLTGPADVGFASVEETDSSTTAPLAIGRAVVELPWVGFSAVEVDERSRRQGHARSIMSALIGWAAERGAIRAWLEVMADNTGALALYESLGFTEHHRYSYRQPS
jgi:GNAT superfamily N-acetyltransferase